MKRLTTCLRLHQASVILFWLALLASLRLIRGDANALTLVTWWSRSTMRLGALEK